MKTAAMTAACLAAGLVGAWPDESRGAPVPTGLGVQVTATQSIDQLWFFYMVGNSPLRVATIKTDLGSFAAGESSTTGVSVSSINQWTDSWMVAGYYTDGLNQKHLVVSTSNNFGSDVTASPALSFDQTFNRTTGTRVNRNGQPPSISEDGTQIGSIPDGTDVVWNEATIIDSLIGTNTLSYIYASTGENMPYGEAFLGDASYNLYTGSANWLEPRIGQSGKLIAFSDASVIGTATVAVPEPTALVLLVGAGGALLARRNKI